MTACDGSFNNCVKIQAQCDGCEGRDGSRRCATSSNYNNLGLDMMTWRRRNEYNFNNNTYIEKPSHPHNRAQFGVTAILEPSQPSQPKLVSNNNEIIENGLEFILSHFEEPIYPRKISTYKTKCGQFSVSDKQEIIDSFRDSNWVDCRINAFPPFTNYKEIQICPSNLLFIDLDKNDFKSITALKLALSNTLKKIKDTLDPQSYPTVLFSGNGYHIIQPVSCPEVLENVNEFKKYDKPSQEFLRFAKNFLSNGKADKNHNPSFKSCLLRVPNSINSKSNTKVTIIQKWNGYRPSIIGEILYHFKTFLVNKKNEERNRYCNNINNNNNYYYCYYDWIEKLVLQTPIEDGRKKIIELVLSPYFILIKKLSYEETFQKIKEWLHQSDSLRRLDFDITDHVNSAIKTVYKKQIPPMSIYKLKTKYLNLYFLLDKNNNNNISNNIVSLSSNQTERERVV